MELTRTLTHSKPVLIVAYSPDGKFVAAGLYDNSIKVWQASNGELVRAFFGHAEAVRTITSSPYGKHIVSGSRDKDGF
jgi:WD40 repeat protein